MSEAVHIQAVHQAPLAVHQGLLWGVAPYPSRDFAPAPPPVATGWRGDRFPLSPSGLALGVWCRTVKAML